MTTGTLHTPLEELLFFQSLRSLGSDAAANFANVSATLQANEFVRASPDFDADRLSPGNLQQLYLRLLKDEVRDATHAGASPAKGAEANRRKRKLSTPPLQSLDEAAQHTHLLPQLVDRLYARYQEHMVRAIREDEVRYGALSKEIAEIERGEWDERLAKGVGTNGSEVAKQERTREDVAMKLDPEALAAGIARPGSTASEAAHRPSPPKNLLTSTPAPSPALPSATGAARLPPAVSAPSPGVPLMDPTMARGRGSRSPNPRAKPSVDGRAASMTPNTQQGPSPHPQTAPPPGYGQPSPFPYYPNQPYPAYAAHGGLATMPTYPNQSPAQHPHYPLPAQQMYQTPRPSQAPQYGGFSSPHPAYTMYQPQPSAFSTPQQAGQTSAARRHNLPAINTSVSTTKWKSTGPAQKSPIAPPRSPFLPSSPENSPTDETKAPLPPTRRSDDTTGTPTRGSGRRGRWVGHTARGRGSRAETQRGAKESRTRSQSIISHAEESAAEAPQTRRLRGDLSTPNPLTEDTSAISTPASTSRQGQRRNTIRGSVDIGRPALKRKRANTIEGSPELPNLPRQPTRPNHILATRNFHRIVQPLMQEINSHKLASMFAKPITERDAPGYQSIIYQAQDLKSIRAAIATGSRVVQAAEKELTEAGGDDVASPAAALGSAGGSKSSSIWLEKSADVVPPKAIVNSAQLEKEVYRMFANAVMFNLDPHRGLGAAARGAPVASGGKAADGEDEDAEKHYEVDDGGAFVRDAREMFTSVDESVSRWRAVEGGGSGARARGADESEADELANE